VQTYLIYFMISMVDTERGGLTAGPLWLYEKQQQFFFKHMLEKRLQMAHRHGPLFYLPTRVTRNSPNYSPNWRLFTLGRFF
jgi:hypothetical protein